MASTAVRAWKVNPWRQSRHLQKPHQEAQDRYGAKADGEVGEDEGLVVLDDFAQDSVDGEEEETAADVRHDGVEPEGGDVGQESQAQDGAEEGGGDRKSTRLN